MAKGTHGKSSATSATRKKHAKKNTEPEDILPKDNRPKKEKGKKREPRQKIYIPPVKPAPVQPDPLETTGLAHTLPADLLIVLRSFNKKAQVTKIRALEELQSSWVNKCLKEIEEGSLASTLVDMLPVWMHHVPALFLHPSRRIRMLTATLHASLLHIPSVRHQMFFYLSETASTSQVESILGPWCIAAYDVDKSVSMAAARAWRDAIGTTTKHLQLSERLQVSLVDFIQRTVLDPAGTYDYLNPAPPIMTAQSQPQSRKASGRSTPARRNDIDQVLRTKADDFEEDEQDRKARMRVGALGSITWVLESNTTLPDNLVTLFANPVFWTCVNSSETCPWVNLESFGYGQPIVRKASWRLVHSLISTHRAHLTSIVQRLGTAILRSAWVEQDSNVKATMWQPLLMFLKEFPSSWELDYLQSQNDFEDSASENESDNEQPKASSSLKQELRPSLAYRDFLQFLQLGCSDSPLQWYPTAVVVLSTIPSSIIATSSSTPLDDFFTSFWAALDGRALSSLHRSATSAAFMSSLLECTVFLLKRLKTDSRSKGRVHEGGLLGILGKDVATVSQELIQEQFKKVLEELESDRLRVEQRAAARMLAQTLESLDQFDSELFKAAWDTISFNVKNIGDAHSGLVAALLKVFYDRFKDGTSLKDATTSLLTAVLNDAVEKLERILRPAGEDLVSIVNPSLLVDLLDQFRAGLFHDEPVSVLLDNLFCQNSYPMLRQTPNLLLSFISHRESTKKVLQLWHSLLSEIANHPEATGISIIPLLEAAKKGNFPRYLKPEGNGLDQLVGQLLAKALSSSACSQDVGLTQDLLLSSEFFLPEERLKDIFDSIASSLKLQIEQIFAGDDVPLLEISLDLISSIYKKHPKALHSSESLDSLLPDIFLYGHLLPLCQGISSQSSFSVAEDFWKFWCKSEFTTAERKMDAVSEVRKSLKLMIADTQTRSSPKAILQLLTEQATQLQVDVVTDILPSEAELDTLWSSISPSPSDSSIGVIDPLIPSSSSNMQAPPSHDMDRDGFSCYSRSVSSLLHFLIQDRAAAKRNVWALRHFIALSICAHDFQSIPSVSSPVFDEKVWSAVESWSLVEVILKVQQITAYLLLSGDGGDWRRNALTSVLNGNESLHTQSEHLGHFLVQVIRHATDDGDNVRDTRVLRTVLQHVLDDVEVGEADLWLQLARKIERTAPNTSIAIVASITKTGSEPPKLDRYRNELAASLLGIPPREANIEGLLALRKLAASAPDPGSIVVFLPQQRAINVVKACKRWVEEGDDDDDAGVEEEVESAMLLVFITLAPILQNAVGGHWGFIFDVLETVLENSAITNDETLVGLSRSLKLVIVLEDLTATNKALRAEWEGRRMNVLKMVRDLATIHLDNAAVSLPRSTCRELILSIVRTLPGSLIDHDTLPKMCHLITDPSVDVQKMAYEMLKTAAHKRTEHLVIEVGVGNIGSDNVEDVDAAPKEDVEEVKEKYKDRKRRQKEKEKDNRASLLPLELLQIVQRDVSFMLQAGGDEEESNMFGWMLGWMLIFDLFQDTSFKVKSMYIEQLRNLDIVGSRLIPSIINLLRLDEGLGKAFKVDLWGVHEFFIDLYEPSSSISIPVLGAHLYYRALLCVPSLIHTWVLDCKDRQLTSSLITFTSQHFSPLIIRAELAHVRSAEGMAELVGDGMSVKVIGGAGGVGGGGGNEVIAAYLVDEHQLEIKLKIPVDWPLHRIEVKDVKRVGVDENRWRAWVLGVQQTIWTHNGRLVDGLSLFKKNVTLHFEGQVECAICYSIISVMDGSLPKKPCKTCKNRFHAGCLYKWFNTSHSSSCPLCRSDII